MRNGAAAAVDGERSVDGQSLDVAEVLEHELAFVVEGVPFSTSPRWPRQPGVSAAPVATMIARNRSRCALSPLTPNRQRVKATFLILRQEVKRVRTYVLDRSAPRSGPLPPSDRAPSTLDGRGRRPRASNSCSRTRFSSCISTSSGAHLRLSRQRGGGSSATSPRGRPVYQTSPG